MEALEQRRLLAVLPLPFRLDFNADAGGILDKDGEGTGFTRVQANRLGTEYQPSLIDLKPTLGVLEITSSGDATSGTNRDGNNTLTNGVEVEFNGSHSFQITARLPGPLGYLDAAYEQGGIMFGPDQDNYIKLVATARKDGQYLQFNDEQYVSGSYLHTVDELVSIGSFDAVNSLDLRLTGNAMTGMITAQYAVNGGAFSAISTPIALEGAKRDEFFSSVARAGLIVLHKNNGTPVTIGFDSFEILARPSVTASIPGDGDTNVSRDAFVGADLNLPNGALNPDTVNSSTVRMYKTGTGAAVAGVVNTSGGGDSIVFQPSNLLQADTQYTFEVTEGVADITGMPIMPYKISFNTGSGGGSTVTDIEFEKVLLSNTDGYNYTGVDIGPDRKLYASTLDGRIVRWAINSDGTLGTAQVINSLRDANGGARLMEGFVFDPASTADNLIIWATHGQFAFDDAEEWTGKLTRLSGPNLENVHDAIIYLPRSAHNHLTNQPVFGPDGKLYFHQGGNTAQGDLDTAWSLRPERLLSAAILQYDPSTFVAGNPLDVKTEDTSTPYNPWPTDAPLRLYATGLRNAYDMVWTRDGRLYVPNNGSNPGGATPATPELPIHGSIRIDGDDDNDPNNGMYSGPAVPGINPLEEGQNDYLHLVEQYGYYGHPNPSRAEFVLNGGNPTSGVDPYEIVSYPVGVLPDRNFRGAVYDFGGKRSPNGAIEFKGAAFGGTLDGALMVVRFSGGDDIIILRRNPDGTILEAITGAPGTTGFADPLDLIQDPVTGFIYVAEYAGKRVTLLRTSSTVPEAPANPSAIATGPIDIHLSWSAVSNANSYIIERMGPGDADFVNIGVTTSTSYVDRDTTALQTYSYRIRASNSAGASAASAVVSATTAAPGLWGTTTSLPEPMAELGGAVISTKMYVAGENDPYTWIYDFNNPGWSSGAIRPYTGDVSEAEHATETVGGLLYLIGGLTGGSENKVQIYNPTTNSWSLGADRPWNAGSSLSAVINGKIYVAGGAVTSPSYGPVGRVGAYDPSNNAWTEVAAMPYARHSAAGGTDGQKLWIFGGRDQGLEASDGTDTVQVYDPVTNTWVTSLDLGSDIPPMPRPMRGAGIKAIYYNGEFYIFGGENSSGSYGATDDNVFDRVDIYNPATRTWRQGLPMPTARHAMVPVLYQDKIYIVGGGTERGTSFSTMVEVLDLLANPAPQAPTNLTAIADAAGDIDLAWNDNANNETSYQVWRSTDGANFTLYATLGINAESFTDTSVTSGGSYYYFVRAVNSTGSSGNSITYSVVADEPTAPAAPANLVATAPSSSQVNLSWDASAGAQQYRVERKGPGESSFGEIGTTASTSYIDAGLLANQSYSYRVRAENSIGLSDYSNTVAVTTPEQAELTSVDIDATPPGQTIVLTERLDYDVIAGGKDIWGYADSFRYVYEQRVGDFDVAVQIQSLTELSIHTKAGLMARESLDPASRHVYSAVTAADGYRLMYRAITGGKVANQFKGGSPSFPNVWVRLKREGNLFSGFVSSDGQTWTQTGSVTMDLPTTAYFGFAVTAKSTTTTATAQFRNLTDASAPLAAPAAPSDLSAVAASSNQVDLSWTDNSGNEQSFVILRSSDGTTYAQVGEAPADGTAFSDMTVSSGERYYYVVRAKNSGGESLDSNVAQVDVPAPSVPVAPSNLAATAVSSSQINLSWTASPEATLYRVERMGPGESSFTEIGTVTEASYRDEGLIGGESYSYRVRAQNAAGLSDYSSTASATTPILSPLTSVDIDATPAGQTIVLTERQDYDVIAGGSDIWGTSDGFRYVYEQRVGDFDVAVRIQSLTQLSIHTKAGIMARESLNGNSRHVFSAATAGDGNRLMYRASTWAKTSIEFKGGTTPFPDIWMRLKRVGNEFFGYYSHDGSNWTAMGSVTMSLPQTIHLGLAVTAKSTSSTTTAQFRGYGAAASGTTSSLALAQHSYTAADIGSPTIAGSTTGVSGGYDLIGLGSDIWGTSDQFHYFSRSIVGDFDLAVQVQGLEPTSPTAKAGIMAREGLTADAGHVFATATASDGYRFLSRTMVGGSTLSAFSGGVAAFPSVWLRLARVGDLLTAYYSSDGFEWIEMVSLELDLATSLYIGLAVTSNNVDAATTAEFRSYSDA